MLITIEDPKVGEVEEYEVAEMSSGSVRELICSNVEVDFEPSVDIDLEPLFPFSVCVVGAAVGVVEETKAGPLDKFDFKLLAIWLSGETGEAAG